MLLIPLLIPFLLLTFLLFMERVEDVLLGQHPDEEEAVRLQRAPEAGQVRAPARPVERVRHHGDAGRRRSSTTSGRSEHAPRTGRLHHARDRAVRRSPVRRVDEVGLELHRRSA
ncbi:hypothetical protein [Pseudonocardia humida]|uniref:Secreted protein n=1 Tax=Pseudonocardia humida TaxID=2800819 RepID=A0ABT1A6G9_9PSEU|nr:hypothetical protein [Pseudonocardia humida]MCO1658571.1 hypothetical protein [Pseudonocardia humida]